MQSEPDEGERPEKLIYRLAAKLRHQALLDSLLIFSPPVGAAIYIIAVLFGAAWLGQIPMLVSAALVMVLGCFAVVLRYRPAAPSVSAAAQLLDRQAAAKDHFLTLATVKPADWPASFLSRLRRETSGFSQRVELKRDFPYRLKSSAYWSFGLSLLAAILISFLLPLTASVARPGVLQDRLRALGQEMALKPGLKKVGKDLLTLAAKLDEPKIPPEEKQTQAQELKKEIEEQQKKEEQKDNRDLLGQAASALEGVEQQQAGGQERKDEQKGGGGIQSDVRQQGQGKSEQSQGGSGDSKGDSSAQLSTELQQGKTAQGNPKEPSSEKNQQPGDAKQDNQPDPSRSGKEQNKEQMGKTEGGSKDGAGKEKSSEEPPPQGVSPAERFYKGGEGKEGIKNARYVTVQLHEEIAAEGKGESRATKESKASRARNQVPVSNVPLPAHVPNAPSEKQQVPIEYRGMIR